MIKRLLISGLVLFLALTLALPGCTGADSPPEKQSSLKVGAISMMTVLPLYVAQQDGLFKLQGIDVEIVPFRSQIDRDTALNTGELDGVIEDIYSLPVFNKDGDLVKVVAVSPVQGYMFAIIASKGSSVNSPSDLRGVEIASSLGNIIEYVTDRMCEARGLQPDEVKKSSIASMPLRLEMLNQGKIESATLSRPLSDMALLGGARIICDDSQESLLTSSIIFTRAAINDRPDDIRKFLAAWSQATEKISVDPAAYRSLLVSVASIPDEIAHKIEVPGFDKIRLPELEEYQTKMQWNLEKGNINHPIPYDEVVATGFLP